MLYSYDLMLFNNDVYIELISRCIYKTIIMGHIAMLMLCTAADAKQPVCH